MTLDLNLRVIRANAEVSSPSALFIHGFASSGELNWERSRWLKYFTDAGRNVLLVDLPGHGNDPRRNVGSWAPSQIRQALAAIVMELDEGPVDVIGYSLGSRLAWEFAAFNPDLVEHLVIGGPGAGDPLAAFELAQAKANVATGEPINDDYTAAIMKIAAAEPSNDLAALFDLIEAIKTEPYDAAAKVPSAPTLLVAGDQDDLATTMPRLRRLLKDAGTPNEVLWLAGRNHANAVTSREFKEKALAFVES
ncbi:alpha/beta fold hydrolase [Glutamicibacter sp. TV12E]|uniref:alpha/beta fold hydrolase n=1 Tax=Glutamicibacter sp. TV12E TaxID=3446362 RepID=UPI004033BA57